MNRFTDYFSLSKIHKKSELSLSVVIKLLPFNHNLCFFNSKSNCVTRSRDELCWGAVWSGGSVFVLWRTNPMKIQQRLSEQILSPQQQIDEDHSSVIDRHRCLKLKYARVTLLFCSSHRAPDMYRIDLQLTNTCFLKSTLTTQETVLPFKGDTLWFFSFSLSSSEL